MFLLRIKTRHWEKAQLFEDFAIACHRASEHVGTHNPDDGCSSPPIKANRPNGSFSIWRNTSFGLRQAQVEAVSTDMLKEIRSW